MVTKLRYVGVCIDDLIDIYKLYIRSSVAYHYRLNQEDSAKVKRIQRTCLKVILGEMFISYESALEMCGLDTLIDRRRKRCLNFSLKCLKHPRNSRMFPSNAKEDNSLLPKTTKLTFF